MSINYTNHFPAVSCIGLTISMLIISCWAWGPFPEKKTAPRTFIDSLNQGREIALKETDFGRRQMVVDSVVPVGSAIQTQPVAAPATRSVSTSNTAAVKEGQGFRVQCFAVSQIENARAEKKNLEDKTSLPVYIKFESPYYKLQAGDFTDRTKAELQLRRIKDLGYTDAWIAKTTVLLP